MPDQALALPDFTLGIVRGGDATEAHLCLLGHMEHTLAEATVRTRGVPLRQDDVEAGRFDAIDDAGLDALQDVFTYGVPSGAGIAVCAEADRLLPDDVAVGAPLAVFGCDDAVVATLIALGVQRLGVRVVFGFYEVPERAALVLHHVDAAPRAVDARQPRFIGRALLGALARQWLNASADPAARAVAAALIARNPGLYAYWSTFSEPPSLGDVVLHVRGGQQRMLVWSPTATFSMRVRPLQVAVDELALDYAECRQQHAAALGERDSHKLALVELCKRHCFDLRTIGHRPDIDATDPRRVWPWPDEDQWVTEALARGG